MKNTKVRHPKLANLLGSRRISSPVRVPFNRKIDIHSGHYSSPLKLGCMGKGKPGQRLIKLARGSHRLSRSIRMTMMDSSPMSDAELVMKRLLGSINKDDPRKKHKLLQFSNNRKSYGLGRRGLIDLVIQDKPENQKVVHSFEDFKNKLKERVEIVNNSARNYSLDSGLKYTIDNKYLESSYAKMEKFAIEHHLEKHKDEFLWHIAQLYPSLTEIKNLGKTSHGDNTSVRNVMKRISKSQEKRIREVQNRIIYLIDAGIITEDINESKMSFWNEILLEIGNWQKAFAKKGKFYFFQPHLFYFVKFLNKINMNEDKGKFFYSLFNEFELLEDLYGRVYSNIDISREERQEDIEGKIAKTISRINTTKHVKMLMKYTR